MKNLRKLFTVFLILVGFISIFAEGEHVHNEECGCEIADARDLVVDTSLQLSVGLLNPEIYEKLKELEENINIVYSITEDKVSYEEFEELLITVLNIADQIVSIEERTNSYIDLSIEGLKEEFLTNISEKFDELRNLTDDLRIAVDIHDADILKIYETLGSMTEEINLLSEKNTDYEDAKNQIEELSLKLNQHDLDIVNIYDVLTYKADISIVEKLEHRLNEITANFSSEMNTGLDTRIELLEEYTNMIYEVANTKVSAEEVEEMISPLKTELTDVSKRLSEIVEKTKIQDVDIIKLYDAVAKLAEELRRIGGRLSTLESLVNELRNK